MSCTSCGRANRPGARFCGSCGKPLAPRCLACGTECEPGAQFCDACGASLVASAPDEAVVRKVGLVSASNTGEVVVNDEQAAGLGDPLNVAARLKQEARDGDVLISESTHRLVRELVTLAPFGVFSLKGRSETVAADRVVS